MTDEDGYYLDPTLVHLNTEVMRRKIKGMEAQIILITNTVNTLNNALRLTIEALDKHLKEKPSERS